MFLLWYEVISYVFFAYELLWSGATILLTLSSN